jgi:hypothetical protein
VCAEAVKKSASIANAARYLVASLIQILLVSVTILGI